MTVSPAPSGAGTLAVHQRPMPGVGHHQPAALRPALPDPAGPALSAWAADDLDLDLSDRARARRPGRGLGPTSRSSPGGHHVRSWAERWPAWQPCMAANDDDGRGNGQDGRGNGVPAPGAPAARLPGHDQPSPEAASELADAGLVTPPAGQRVR